MYTSYYNFFGTGLEFKTNSLLELRGFKKVFWYFECPSLEPQVNCTIEKQPNFYQIKTKSKRYSLEYKIPTIHPDVYLSLFTPVVYEVRDYFLIHSGSLSTQDGKSLIISAPCGFGKTTLTRELIKKGFNFLSDELAPLNIKTGLIEPYPRGMGVLKAKCKEIVDVPERVGKPCNPGFVVFLTLEKTSDENIIEVALGRLDKDIIDAFRKIQGVRKVIPIKGRMFPMLRLLLEEKAHVVTRMQDICTENNVTIIYTLKGRTKPPNYNAVPQLKEISQTEGIFELSQNILNTHNSALIEETFSGSRARMLFELAGLMNKARFFTLTVGRLQGMVDLICRL